MENLNRRPRVARASQPWADGRSPGGAEKRRKNGAKSEQFTELFLGDTGLADQRAECAFCK